MTGPFAPIREITLYGFIDGDIETHVPVLDLTVTGRDGAQRAARALLAVGLPGDTGIRLKPLGAQAWGRQTLAGMAEHGPRKGSRRHPNDPRDGATAETYDDEDA